VQKATTDCWERQRKIQRTNGYARYWMKAWSLGWMKTAPGTCSVQYVLCGTLCVCSKEACLTRTNIGTFGFPGDHVVLYILHAEMCKLVAKARVRVYVCTCVRVYVCMCSLLARVVLSSSHWMRNARLIAGHFCKTVHFSGRIFCKLCEKWLRQSASKLVYNKRKW
jgi:hypothetical protein